MNWGNYSKEETIHGNMVAHMVYLMSPPIMSSPATDFYKIINSVSFQDFPKGGWHECMDIIR
jgi:hypothetical protein